MFEYNMATKDKVICPVCQREGKRSKVILNPGQTLPEMKFTKGYWDENGDFVMPDVDFEPPWYICSNGHITQTFSK